MISFDFTINILVLALLMLAACLVGFGLRSRQLRKKQMKIAELRKEIIESHAHILELQKEYVALESRIRESRTPVLGIRNAAKGYEGQDLTVMDSAI